MTYQPIANYGIIGNLHTTALVGLNGSVDWFCFPNHDSPSLFGLILDRHKGGYFKISPLGDDTIAEDDRLSARQMYLPGTNVLITRFLTEDGIGEVTDFMPIDLKAGEAAYHSLIRQVKVTRGTMQFHLCCCPAFNYARDAHQTHLTQTGAAFESPQLSLELLTDLPLQIQKQGVAAEFTLSEGETAIVVLQPKADRETHFSCEEITRLFHSTIDYWRRWLSQCTYKGRWREMVERSALVLKLLTFVPTGAIVAAPTCSLPEQIGGERNWDYRYTWIRDAAFTTYALLRLGFAQEAANFMGWIEQLCHHCHPNGAALQIVYGIDGRAKLEEQILDHLEGYQGSQPVRIGNEAYLQFQLDIYGELMDAVYLYNKHGAPISYDFWAYLRQLVDWVCDNWQRPDQGMWEVRGEPQQFVYSKLMCWVTIDRGLRLADKRSFPADRTRWLQVRDQIYEEIMTRGWNATDGSFVQSYDSTVLDASNLLMPLVFFLSPNDPRMLKTLDAIRRSPQAGGLTSGDLVYRYDTQQSPDGVSGDEGTFNMCTFWLVEALTRAGRVDAAQLEQARLLFEKMLSYANHLGLYAEETSLSGEAIGNFPQGFTHIALISAAWNLNKALGEES